MKTQFDVICQQLIDCLCLHLTVCCDMIAMCSLCDYLDQSEPGWRSAVSVSVIHVSVKLIHVDRSDWTMSMLPNLNTGVCDTKTEPNAAQLPTLPPSTSVLWDWIWDVMETSVKWMLVWSKKACAFDGGSFFAGEDCWDVLAHSGRLAVWYWYLFYDWLDCFFVIFCWQWKDEKELTPFCFHWNCKETGMKHRNKTVF